MNQYKKIILSGTLMGAVAFAPLVMFAEDNSSMNGSGSSVNTGGQNNPTITPDTQAKIEALKAEYKAKIEALKQELNSKIEALAPGIKLEGGDTNENGGKGDFNRMGGDKSMGSKTIDFTKAKDKFMKEVTSLTAKQSGLSKALDAQATAGKDVTLAKSNLALAEAKLADASAAGSSIADKATLSTAKKLLEEAKSLTGKVMGRAKGKGMKGENKGGDHKKSSTNENPTTPGATNQ